MKSGCDSDIEASFMSLTLHGLWLNEMVEKFSLNIDNPIYIYYVSGLKTGRWGMWLEIME